MNGVFDGTSIDIDRWIMYGNQSPSNTFTVQAIDSAGNRSPVSSLTLDDQFCPEPSVAGGAPEVDRDARAGDGGGLGRCE